MLNLLLFDQIPIEEQLSIEEDLLRNDDKNWCILNTGSKKTIILGLSSKKEEMLNIKKVDRDNIPVIKRFSGGGTVIVDSNTLFATFIFQKKSHCFPPYPKSIANWTKEFYQKALQIPHFDLKENDYTIKNHKVGGNAQYIRKNRWLHHSSFLYDFEDTNMDYLLNPITQPSYRNQRNHLDFLTRLKPHISKKNFIKKIQAELNKRYQIASL